MEGIKNFSDVAKTANAYPNAEFIKDKETLVGKTIVIKAFEERESATGKYLTVNADHEGKDIVFSIGGVVADQLIKVKTDLPLNARFGSKKSADGRVYFTLE